MVTKEDQDIGNIENRNQTQKNQVKQTEALTQQHF